MPLIGDVIYKELDFAIAGSVLELLSASQYKDLAVRRHRGRGLRIEELRLFWDQQRLVK